MHFEFVGALADFDLYNEARGRSERTRHWYSHQLHALGHFLAERKVAPATIAGRDILAFLATERRRGIAEASVDARFRALRAFFKWIEKAGYFDGLKNPVAADYKPKIKKKIGKRVTVDTYSTLLASITGDDWSDARDRALVAVLFRCGLRASECTSLSVADLNLRDRQLFIRGDTSKSKEDAIVPMDSEARRLLMEYLFNRPVHPSDQDILWYSNDGVGGVRANGLTADGLYQILKRRCAAAGLPRLSPQTFRRGFGSALLNHGTSMSTVSKLLRHSSVTVTEEAYAEWERLALQGEYDEAQLRIDQKKRSTEK